MYNLLAEAWVSVLRVNGQVDRAGIRDALIQAGGIRQVATSTLVDDIALSKTP